MQTTGPQAPAADGRGEGRRGGGVPLTYCNPETLNGGRRELISKSCSSGSFVNLTQTIVISKGENNPSD